MVYGWVTEAKTVEERAEFDAILDEPDTSYRRTPLAIAQRRQASLAAGGEVA